MFHTFGASAIAALPGTHVGLPFIVNVAVVVSAAARARAHVSLELSKVANSRSEPGGAAGARVGGEVCHGGKKAEGSDHDWLLDWC